MRHVLRELIGKARGRLKYVPVLRDKPSVVPRALRQWVSARVLGRAVLRGVELAVTFDCQGRCTKCSCVGLVANREVLTRAEILATCRRIVDAGAILINLTGGEPLLRADIVDIVSDLRPLPALVSITSNGLLASAERVAQLRGAGLNLVQLSLNSPVAEEHDREIGVPGSYDRVLAAIDSARAVGLTVLINAVITAELVNSWRMEALSELARRRGCFLSLVFPAQVGGWREQQVRLGAAELAIVKRRWLPQSHVTCDTETSYQRGMCPAGGEKIYITAYGDLCPCPFIQCAHGNVREQDVIALWRAMRAVNRQGCCNITPS